MSDCDHSLAAFAPITLDEANQLAELQTRVDRKYLVDEATLVQLLEALQPTMNALDIDGSHTSGYHSTYFDTPALALYSAAVQGRRHRYKIRSRSYGESGPCFLEVKAKGRRGLNVKSRIGYRRCDQDKITIDGSYFIEEATGLSDLAPALVPVLTTAYNRSTLIDPANQTRVTIDRGLRCGDGAGGEASLHAFIIETKSSGAPAAADKWLWRNHVRPTKISKFGTGLGALRPELGANKWHRVLNRYWQTTFSDSQRSHKDFRPQSQTALIGS